MNGKNNSKTAMSPAQREAQMRQNNAGNANLLKRTTPLTLTALPSQSTTAAGQVIRTKLKNVGYIGGLLVTVTATVNIGVAAATLSPRGLFALINRVKLTDYSNTDRINVPAHLLWLINCVQDQTTGLAGMPNLQSSSAIAQNLVGLTSNYANPVLPLAVGAQTLSCTFYVPLAYDLARGDLRGMMDAGTVEGEAVLSLEMNPTIYANGNDDSVFNGSGTTTVALTNTTVDVLQMHYFPQADGQGRMPRPMIDLNTVNEIVSSKMTDNISVGSQKVINLLNNRDVRRVVMNYQNGGILGGSGTTNGLSRFQFLVGGAIYIEDITEQQKQFLMLQKLGTTMPKGSYFYEFPHGIQTKNYGTTQIGVFPTGTLSSPYLEVGYQSLYRVGNAALSSNPQS